MAAERQQAAMERLYSSHKAHANAVEYRHTPAQIATAWGERCELDERLTAEQLLGRGTGAAAAADGGGAGFDGDATAAVAPDPRKRSANELLRKLHRLEREERRARRATERELRELKKVHTALNRTVGPAPSFGKS